MELLMTPSLTTLASIKRACTMDASLQLVEVENMPWLQQTIAVGPRPIAKVQTNAIAIKGCHRNGGETYDPNIESWIYWPKAADITPHGDDTFTMRFANDRSAKYRVVPT
jgi:hypothetical protein